jgi:hypothetical protein
LPIHSQNPLEMADRIPFTLYDTIENILLE